MLTQLQLEGPELEPLLARVRSELGSAARIVQAEKVRTGGVAGFFARERYALTVEVDDEHSGPAGTPGTGAQDGADGAATAAGPDAFSTHPAFAALAGHVPAAPPVPQPAPAPCAPLSLDELAERVSDEEHAALVSTESPSFASLLSQLGSRVGADVPAAGLVPSQRTAAASVAVRYDAGPDLGGDQRTAGELPPPADGTSADAASADGTADAASAAQSADDTAGARLGRLGLPAHLRPQGSGDQLHTSLRAALTRLPTAPPVTNRAGAVLAVVGPLALALRVAREVAEELGLPATTSVVVATSHGAAGQVPARQVLHAPAEAGDRRAAWRRRGNLTVVAVDAPLTSTGAAQAREFLAALSPTATWGVVEATRKSQDVGAWTRALGGVHALALTDVEETADPAAVLELDIPVSRLGARPATPRAWATLLTGRLAA